MRSEKTSEKEPEKLYLVSRGAQKREIEELCFDECGKISVGGVTFEGGFFEVCEREDCLFEEDTLEAGPCELDNGRIYDITLHKLAESKKWR